MESYKSKLSMPLDDLHVIPVQSRRELKTFIKLPYSLYRNDPNWIPPLYLERRNVLHPKKNPFYQHAIVQLFLAKRGNQTVGRISAHIDLEYEKFHGERVGNFGFFESIQDQEVANALISKGEEFLRRHRATRIRGPFNFSINDESGLLIDGFDQPQMIMMPYNPPYYQNLLENSGLEKAKDLYAWYFCAKKEIPQGPAGIAEAAAQHPGLVVRSINQKDFKGDLAKIMDVFNSAWSKNWGFVPLTPNEVAHAAKEFKIMADPNMVFLAEVNGDPAGMCVTIPNFYEYIKDLNGKLFPFGFIKLLWRIKRKKYKNCRLMMLGVKKEYRGSVLGGLSVLLYIEVNKRGRNKVDFGELSWTLEDNQKINQGIEFMGGRRYKTMRVYEKTL